MFEPRTIKLTDPWDFLAYSALPHTTPFALGQVEVLEPFGLVGLAAMARKGSAIPLVIDDLGMASRSAVRFAHALGLEAVIEGAPTRGASEPERTAAMRRLPAGRESTIDAAVKDIGQLLLPRGLADEDEEPRQTIEYVLAELMRNVLQHSGDPLGGVVCAQLMNRGKDAGSEVVQVSVADCGIGVPAALSHSHPTIASADAAVSQAICAHISGTFHAGFTGNQRNAGLGLFMVSEMAKLTGGRFLLASRGASLLITGDSEGQGKHEPDLRNDHGFPGTLVVFEIRRREVSDFRALLDRISAIADERIPQWNTTRWLRYESAPPSAKPIRVNVAAEDTEDARRFVTEVLLPRLSKKESVSLDFTSMKFCTQSFAHALLFEPLRIAWALKTPIYIQNASPAVRTILDMLERYALKG